MRNPAFLASLTLFVLAFAGCAGGDGGEGDGTSTSASASGTSTSTATASGSASRSSTGTTTSAGSTGAGPASNSPPTGSVSAEVNGTAVAFRLNGTDADGDALSWTLDFGDASANAAGDSLPANLTHEYAVGDYTVNFTVTDGEASKSYDVAVTIAAAGGAGQSVVFAGSITAPDPFAVADGICILPLADFAGTGTWGGLHNLPSEVEPNWQFVAMPDSVIATFIDAEGNVGGSGNSGTVGEGMTQAMACGTAPMVDYTVTLTPPA